MEAILLCLVMSMFCTYIVRIWIWNFNKLSTTNDDTESMNCWQVGKYETSINLQETFILSPAIIQMILFWV
jgi:hypothetical protein